MNLFVAWRDSLAILQPKNLKLFLLVTLKSMGDTFKVWIKYCSWLLLLYAVKLAAQFYIMATPAVEMPNFLVKVINFLGSLPTAVFLFIPSLLLIIRMSVLLAARPSTAIKNCAYFRAYFWRLLIISIAYELLYVLGFYVSVMNAPHADSSIALRQTYVAIVSMLGFLGSFYFINAALFYFDGDGSVRSFCKSWLYAAKMTLYNLPFYIIFMVSNLILLMIPTYIYLYGMHYMMQYSWAVIVIASILMLIIGFLELFILCFLTNFYVKKLHDQFTLYFGKND